MRANRVYRLAVSRQGPRLFRAPDAVDVVEVVEIETNECLLVWDVPATDCRRFTNMLKADLASLDAEEFLGRWAAVSQDDL